MSDSAIFITVATEELKQNGQLPGDLRSLRNLADSGERVVHFETVTDSPLPEKTQNALHMAGSILHVLPSATDTTASLVGGLMSRLHEFICAYPHVSQFILAGADVDRLAGAAAFLRRAGFYVIIAGPDRSRLDAVRNVCDDVTSWSGSGRQSASRERDKEDASSKLDPFEVLVEEITKGRKNGNRVLLTSLKQRMRKRIRRFDETRLKDKDGRPMRKFKDFVVDAANRGLIQLIEKGNASHVLLPGEEIPENDEEETIEEETPRKEKGRGKKENVDPLLDNVDMVDEGEDNGEPEEEKDLEELSEKDFDVEKLDEEADAPPGDFMELLEKTIPEKGYTLSALLRELASKREKGELEYTNRQIQTALQNAFYNELLEPATEEQPVTYVVVDDWRDIIDFL